MSAVYTNALSNLFHFFFLFVYSIKSISHWRKHRSCPFSIALVICLWAILKIIGMVTHYYHDAWCYRHLWWIIDFLVFILCCCLLVNLKLPSWFKALLLVFSIILPAYDAVYDNYMAIALLQIGLALVIILTSKQRYIKLAFLFSVIASFTWMALRFGGEWYLQSSIPIALRYDNDIYHGLLIISTWFFYQSIIKREWLTSS